MSGLKQFFFKGIVVTLSLSGQAQEVMGKASVVRASSALSSGFCRMELLSADLQSMARKEGASLDQVSLQAFIDGTPELTREDLEKMGATEIFPVGSQGNYVVRSSFNTLLDLTNHENVLFVQEVPGSLVIKR